MQTFRRLPRLLVEAVLVNQQRQQSSLALAAPAQNITVAAKYIFGVGAAVWASQSEEAAEYARLAYLIPTRLARDVVTAVSIVVGKYQDASSCIELFIEDFIPYQAVLQGIAGSAMGLLGLQMSFSWPLI